MSRKITIKQINASSIPDGKIIKTSGDTFVFTDETIGVTDGDKGDITISNSGNTYTINQKAVSYDQIQDTLNTSILIGRYDAGGGSFQEIMIGTGLMLTGDTLVSTAAFYGSGGTGGEITTASNLGTGIGIYSQKVGSDLRFKSLIAGPNIILSGNSTTIIISGSPSGEINTASNVGNGVNLFKNKNGFDLEFRTLSGTPNQITVISGSSLIRLALPQDINIQSVPNFGAISLGIISSGTHTEYGSNGVTINGTNFQITAPDSNILLSTGSLSGITLDAGNGITRITSIAGVGNRMVIVNPDGVLSSTTINTNNNIGTITGGTNLGNGIAIYSGNSGNNLFFRTIIGGGDILVSGNNTTVIISGSTVLPQPLTTTSAPQFGGLNITNNIVTSAITLTNSARLLYITGTTNQSLIITPNGVISATTFIDAGEANTASNIGGGVGVFSDKSGVDLRFKTLSGTPNQINITSGTSLLIFGLPQDIATTSSPFFNNIIGTGVISGNSIIANRIITASAFTSTVSTGTAPFIVLSTTLVNNLNADLFDGLDSMAFIRTDGNQLGVSADTFSTLTDLPGAIKYSTHTTGSVGYPTAGGANWTFASVTGARTFTFEKPNNNGGDLYFRDYVDGVTPNPIGFRKFAFQDWVHENFISGTTTLDGGINVYSGKLGNNLQFKGMTGRTNQIIISASTDLITFSLPQDIAGTSAPQFGGLNITNNITTSAVTITNSARLLYITGNTIQNLILMPNGIISASTLVVDTTNIGTITGGTNLGNNFNIFSGNSGNNLFFRTLIGAGSISISGNNTTILISGGTLGEINTASNLGVGQEVFINKSDVDLRFRTLSGTPNQINITSGTSLLTFGLPQDIATTSSPTFKDVNASNIVTTGGNQTISGIKTFVSNVTIPDAAAATDAMNRQSSDGRYLKNTFEDYYPTLWPYTGATGIANIVGWYRIAQRTTSTGRGFGIVNIFSNSSPTNASVQLYWGNSNASLTGELRIIGGHGNIAGLNNDGVTPVFRSVLDGTVSYLEVYVESVPRTLYSQVQSFGLDIYRTEPLGFVSGLTVGTTVAEIPYSAFRVRGFQVNLNGSVSSNNYIIASAFTSTIGTGSMPFTVSSTTMVTNLNADMIDGLQGSDLVTGGTALDGGVNVFTTKTGANLLFRGLTGRTNQIIISASTDLITFALPQDIAGTSSVNFSNLNISNNIIGVGVISATTIIANRTITASAFTSTVTTGTRPFVISSTTVVTNLNADMVDSIQGADLVTGGTNFGGAISPFTTKTGANLLFRGLTGRTNQIIISASTSLITFSLPQDIANTSSVNFSNLNITNNIIGAGVVSATTIIANRVVTASAFTSTVRTGMPPLVVSSSTMVVNLNADMIDSIQGNQLITGGTNLGGGVQIFSGNTPYNLNFRTVFGDPTIQISADTTTATVMYKPIIIVTGDSPTGIYPDGAIWIQI
jgi:hypothetical protein